MMLNTALGPIGEKGEKTRFLHTSTCCCTVMYEMNSIINIVVYCVNPMKPWDTQESARCTCGHLSQPLQQVVVDCMLHNAHDRFAGLRRLDAATRTWLRELYIGI